MISNLQINYIRFIITLIIYIIIGWIMCSLNKVLNILTRKK